jgi:hypothetical protein
VTDTRKRKNHDIYLSFIAGPNASTPLGGDWKPRAADRSKYFLQFDTMFRTISKAAITQYQTFKLMISSTLIASLKAMVKTGKKYVIMTACSTGIYSGIHKKRIQAEFHTLCMDALNTVYRTTPHRFTAVLIPKY